MDEALTARPMIDGRRNPLIDKSRIVCPMTSFSGISVWALTSARMFHPFRTLCSTALLSVIKLIVFKLDTFCTFHLHLLPECSLFDDDHDAALSYNPLRASLLHPLHHPLPHPVNHPPPTSHLQSATTSRYRFAPWHTI